MVRTLTANGSALTLRSDTDGWCDVELLLDGRRLQLGAEQEDVLAKRLASAMHDELTQEVAGTIAGINVVYVLSLAEKHTTVFAGDNADRRVLFFQDASGGLVGDVRLTGKDRKDWLLGLTGESE